MNIERTKQCVKELEPLITKIRKEKFEEAEKYYEELVGKFPVYMDSDLDKEVVIFIWAINEYLGELQSYTLDELLLHYSELLKKWPPEER